MCLRNHNNLQVQVNSGQDGSSYMRLRINYLFTNQIFQIFYIVRAIKIFIIAMLFKNTHCSCFLNFVKRPVLLTWWDKMKHVIKLG